MLIKIIEFLLLYTLGYMVVAPYVFRFVRNYRLSYRRALVDQYRAQLYRFLARREMMRYTPGFYVNESYYKKREEYLRKLLDNAEKKNEKVRKYYGVD